MKPTTYLCALAGLCANFTSAIVGAPAADPTGSLPGTPWKCHVIDQDGSGADGTKLADINGDGFLDVATGWEEDGSTRVYLNPGPLLARDPWPKVIVGATRSAEDAFFADLDGDGRVDVVSCSEGSIKRVFVHWGPKAPARLLERDAWKQEVFPEVAGRSLWMFGAAAQLDGRNGVDLILGGKGGNKSMAGDPAKRAVLGWLESPPLPRNVADWKWHPLAEVDWTMSIELEDMNGNGTPDIVFSDRFGPTRGVHWLENPGRNAVAAGADWRRHAVGTSAPNMTFFLTIGDVDGDGLRDIAVPVVLADPPVVEKQPDQYNRLLWYRRLDASGVRWQENAVELPRNTGSVKSVCVGDIDGDGKNDFVISCERAVGERVGVYWLRQAALSGRSWVPVNISGAPGIKYDLVRLLDLDGDGDLDVLTTEEREGGRGLGVIWYENPYGKTARSAERK